MSTKQLIVAGITIPVRSSLTLSQTYDEASAAEVRRKANGAGVKFTLYDGKLSTSLSGSGHAPAGLQAVDTSVAFDISCIAAIGINGAGLGFTIPRTHRVDAGHLPLGYGIVDDNLVSTPLVLTAGTGAAGDTATLTSVSGATSYQVWYYPVITVLSSQLSETFARGSGFNWVLDAEEV